MLYYLWIMDTKGDSRRVACASHVSEMMRDTVPVAKALSKRELLYIQAVAPGGQMAYPWNWSSGRRLMSGDLRSAARRMLRQKRVRLR